MYFDGSVQERRNFIAKALVLRLSCTDVSICILDCIVCKLLQYVEVQLMGCVQLS